MTRWITEYLGSGPYEQIRDLRGVRLIDVRDLVDKEGNTISSVRRKIEEAVDLINGGARVVVACDQGISRSNAVATGILAVTSKSLFDDALEQVIVQTGEKQIKLAVLSTVRAAVSEIKGCLSSSAQGERKILLTGGSGFIGSVLAPRLEQYYPVIMPNRTELDLREDTVRLDVLVKKEGITEILHLANPRIINTNKSFGEALWILKNVIEVCYANRLKLMYLSSFEVYTGHKKRLVSADEALPRMPKSLIGEIQSASERMIQSSFERWEQDYTIIRTGLLYGGDGNKPRFLLSFINKACQGEKITTHKYVNGYPEIDFLHVDDLIEAVTKIYKHNSTGFYNIGSGKLVSTDEIAKKIIQLNKSNSHIDSIDIDDFFPSIILDSKKAKKELKWEPQIGLLEGLKKIIVS